jgi:hypothetical protein
MTTADLEAAAADSAASFIRPKKQAFDKQGEPCKNCGTALEGWYCHSCGQNADTHHRSILHLMWEAIEGMFHLDGRLANTLPLLFFKPGRLAKDYMEGRIVRHVPPFRTFLVALLLFIFAAEHAIHSDPPPAGAEGREGGRPPWRRRGRPQGQGRRRSRKDRGAAEARDASAWPTRPDARRGPQGSRRGQGQDRPGTTPTTSRRRRQGGPLRRRHGRGRHAAEQPNAGAEALARLHGRSAKRPPNRSAAKDVSEPREARGRRHQDRRRPDRRPALQRRGPRREDAGRVSSTRLAETGHGHLGQAGQGRHGKEHWFKEGLAKAIANPEYYLLVMFGWAHRLAVLLLPIIGLSPWRWSM